MGKNKLLKSFLAVGVAASALVGCSSSTNTSSESTTSESTEVTTIKAATSGQTNPYTTIDDDGKNTGYDIEVLKAVFEELPQYELEFVTTDFSSIFEGTLSGSYDIAVNNFSYNEERAESYLYSYPYDEISYVIVTKEGVDDITSFESAAGKKTNGQSSLSITTAEEKWNEEHPDSQIDIQYTEQETPVSLQQVEDGILDFTIIDLAMYQVYEKEYDFKIQAVDLGEEDTRAIAENNYAYYLFAYDHEDLRDEVNEALKKLKENGTLAEIANEWYGRDTSPDESQFEKTLN